LLLSDITCICKSVTFSAARLLAASAVLEMQPCSTAATEQRHISVYKDPPAMWNPRRSREDNVPTALRTLQRRTGAVAAFLLAKGISNVICDRDLAIYALCLLHAPTDSSIQAG